MKFFFTGLLLIALNRLSYAQDPVVDTNPAASIFIIDFQSGQEVAGTSDEAILFKDAFIRLINNSYTAKAILSKQQNLGDTRYSVTQMDPQTNINGYQIMLENIFPDRTTIIFTFLFNVDDQKLYFYDNGIQNWVPQQIQNNNIVNMRRVIYYSKFNDPNNFQQTTVDAQADYNAPVDTNVTANNAPPPMPEYEQPECPSDGYLWQPGFWAFSPARNDYYWVPGAWVAPPNPGVYWTPPYWGWLGGVYVFHTGYWGDHIGFYGGINYGYGYGGVGYAGGEWRGGHFNYNTAVVKVNTTVIHNTYINTTVINRTVVNNHTSFNGPGGVAVKPTPKEIEATKEKHIMPTAEQNRNQQLARADKQQFAKANPGGKPANLAAPKVPEKAPAPLKPPVNNMKPKVGNGNLTGVKPVTPGSKISKPVIQPATKPVVQPSNNKSKHKTKPKAVIPPAAKTQ